MTDINEISLDLLVVEIQNRLPAGAKLKITGEGKPTAGRRRESRPAAETIDESALLLEDAEFLSEPTRGILEVLEYLGWGKSKAATLRNRLSAGAIVGEKDGPGKNARWIVSTESAYHYKWRNTTVPSEEYDRCHTRGNDRTEPG